MPEDKKEGLEGDDEEDNKEGLKNCEGDNCKTEGAETQKKDDSDAAAGDIMKDIASKMK
jgi:hypothetical protein